MYKLKQILMGATFALLTGLAAMSGNAIASTPDGLTPANEGVCDSLQGGTGGLYGLCVAYCEAQDLDMIGKEPPNIKILDNYRKKMKSGDPDMPCVHAPCPCWSAEQMAAITADGQGAMCIKQTTTSIQLIDNAEENRYAYADNSARSRCAYVDLNIDPNTINSQRLNSEQAQICYSMVSQTCSDLGL